MYEDVNMCKKIHPDGDKHKNIYMRVIPPLIRINNYENLNLITFNIPLYVGHSIFN